MGTSRDSDYETRIGSATSDVTINVPDELSGLNQPLLTPLPRAQPNPLDAMIIVPIELAKVESRYGIILSLITLTLIPAFLESISNTTSHGRPLLVIIFAVISYASLLVTSWHKMRFLREEPRDAEMIYIFTGFFIVELIAFFVLIVLLAPHHSVTCVLEIIWTVLGFVITTTVLLNFKFYG